MSFAGLKKQINKANQVGLIIIRDCMMIILLKIDYLFDLFSVHERTGRRRRGNEIGRRLYGNGEGKFYFIF